MYGDEPPAASDAAVAVGNGASQISRSLASPSLLRKDAFSPAKPPPLPQVQFSASDFQRRTLLGCGSMARVYLVEHRKTKKLFAVKVLSKLATRIPIAADMPIATASPAAVSKWRPAGCAR